MTRARAAVVGSLGLSALACFRFPDEQAFVSLDYLIDRPRVVAIRVDPPLLQHGDPVIVDALVLSPSGAVSSVSVDLCGLRGDVPVDVSTEACFNESELVDHLADALPTSWDPPDLSELTCPVHTGFYGADTALWSLCFSTVPLRVTAQTPDGPAFGTIDASILSTEWTAGLPSVPYGQRPRALSVYGEPAAGSEVVLEFRIEGAPDENGFRWWIDAGELVGTGRTAVHETVVQWHVTRNTLRIPADHHGPLRVAVVARSSEAEAYGLVGDVAWEITTLEVP